MNEETKYENFEGADAPKMAQLKYLIIGAGHWGTALASVLALNGNKVKMYSRDSQEVVKINTKHHSSCFSRIKLDSKITATEKLQASIVEADVVIISLPTKAIVDVLTPYANDLKDKIILLTSKGMYQGKTISTLLSEIIPAASLAVLSGPSFAKEVIEKKYTAVVIASKNLEVAQSLQTAFSHSFFRVYTSSDVLGVEYCAALKNVYAIICGIIDGHKMGNNAKTALITRAVAELNQLLKYVNCEEKTLYGLAGVGDLILTCNSMMSRNYTYGYSFPSLPDLTKGPIEGLQTIPEVYKFAQDNHLDLPIINAAYMVIVLRADINYVAMQLMNRALKSESI